MLAKIKYFIRAKLIPNRLFLMNKPAADNPLYLTFDDGPVLGITDLLLALLDRYNVKATFFIIGRCGHKNPELLKSIHDNDHMLANHSYNHPRFNQIPQQRKYHEIDKNNQLIESITQQKCVFFRAPKGHWNLKTIWYLFINKMIPTHWSRDSMDFEEDSASELIKKFKDKPVKSGDIILFHDDATLCIEALEILIPMWQAQGFTFKALGKKTS